MYFLAILLLYFSLHPIAGWGTYCLFVYGFIFSCIGFKKKVHFPIHLLRILFIFFMPVCNVLLFLFSLGESTAADGSSYPPLSLSQKICFFSEAVFICSPELYRWLNKKTGISINQNTQR
ncbi:hypothetical protein EFK13_06760 [Bacillus cabrialesii]|uniref:hypothetical protein n=1 Tax=Bacillus cabrialesii TaxID=2487276 RepID=UPI001F02090E|nr:hypothetical protein [Bacillus cabrialesii]UQE80261.1 hypothetical protein EFK13_06760 [Bacillus cabrialesii]